MRLKNELSHHWAYIFIALGTIISTGPKELQAPNPDPGPPQILNEVPGSHLAIPSGSKAHPQVQREAGRWSSAYSESPACLMTTK